MTRPNVKVKSVHFNITVKEEQDMLKAISRHNFSKYVKQLILADIKKKELQKQPLQQSGGIKYVLKDSDIG